MARTLKKIISISCVALSSLGFAGCLGGNAIDIGADTEGDDCSPGDLYTSSLCTGSCPTGQTSLRRCLATGTFGNAPCGCYGSGAVTPPPPAESCTPTSVRLSTCRTCAAGQIAQETCNSSSRWADCECRAATAGGFCAANSWTNSVLCNGIQCETGYRAQQYCSGGTVYLACQCVPVSGGGNPTNPVCNAGQEYTGGGCNCNVGFESRRRCNGMGSAYDACYCTNVGGGTAQQCTPSTERVCSLSCASGQRPVQVCNAAGVWNDCYCAGSITTVCTANQLTNVSCACPSGGNGTFYCNGNGTGYGTCNCPGSSTTCTPGQLYSRDACVGRLSCSSGQTSLQQCTSAGQYGDCQCGTLSGGGTGGTGNCGGGYIAATARNGLAIRCWGNGRTWTSSGSQLDASTGSLDGNQCGYTECVTGSINSSGAFTEDGYYGNTGNAGRPASDTFSSFGVFGRDSRLNDILGSSTMRLDARGRIKSVFAVSADCIGRGYCS